ncbi:MAG: hypothetical protein PHE88_12095 [Elusimicrobia bacterium]|nr:hypothetical protein [Elusimicrobiota bacterium]
MHRLNIKNSFLVLTFIGLGLINFSSVIYAGEDVSMFDKMISITFKSLAKSYIATSDIDNLKKKNIDKLIKMDEKKFRKQYLKTYPDLQKLPQPIRTKYGITEKLTKKQAIKIFAKFDKKALYEIIDSVPHYLIAEKFKESIGMQQKGDKKTNIMESIKSKWDQIIAKIK